MALKSVRPYVWDAHPAVRTGKDLTFGERSADVMKKAFSTWTAIGAIAAIMGVWIWTGGFGHDPMPFILLNLCLSCLAAVQCFILLIAAKRADQISGELALHAFETGEKDFATDQETLAWNRAIGAHLGISLQPDPTTTKEII